jgi:hypothetical protein
MGIYELKAECLAFLRNVCDHKYEGDLGEQFKTLQAACESRRWAMESSMETEVGLVRWISELDAALAAFKKATSPIRGRDGNEMRTPLEDRTLRAYVDNQIASSKAKAVEMQKSLHAKETLRALSQNGPHASPGEARSPSVGALLRQLRECV